MPARGMKSTSEPLKLESPVVLEVGAGNWIWGLQKSGGALSPVVLNLPDAAHLEYSWADPQP